VDLDGTLRDKPEGVTLQTPTKLCDVDAISGLRSLALDQAGVVTRAQLTTLGLSYRKLEAQLRARRWTPVGPDCILLHNSEPTRLQLMHVGVLHAPRGCLAAATALEVQEFAGFHDERLHVVTPRGTTVWSHPIVVLHESRRLQASDVKQRNGLPVTGIERSAIDRAAWQRRPGFAAAVLAAVVQQGLTVAGRLEAELDMVGRVRHAAVMRLALHDIEGGARALSEINLAKVCRRFGLEPPERQRVRRDKTGKRRYIDAEWRRSDGDVIALEVDGSHHMTVELWNEDMKRQRQVAIGARAVLRCSAMELRLSALDVVTDLVAAGVPRVVTRSRPCGVARE
jgi:hypothetical protein